MIEDALQKKRSLIVLDDIIGSNQLVALLGTGEINSQSKVIITTRENTDSWFHFPYWRYQKYKMKLLNEDESSELLSRHAFGSKTPMAGFEELVLQAIEYCEGNPLALEVLGSSLSKDNIIPNWKSRLNLLGKDIDYRIQDVLLRSYMSLPYMSEKELFLHIACFFIGKDIDYVVKILEPDYSAISGIKTLIDRCLLSVSPNKKLIMHRLLQEMGKNIIRQESTKFPENRSRVWLSRDSYKILIKGLGSKMVEGLALDMEVLQKEDFAFKSSKFKTNALQPMNSLKLLQLNFAELSGSYEYVSEDLRWLCWFGFHLTSIPSNLYMGNLVAIDMSYSNLEVFEPPMDIQSLKILNLKDSYRLTEIRKISRTPNLETLILWNCSSLINVCKTIEGLKSLALLNMTGCKNLFRHINLLAASTFSFSFSLHRLFLNSCHLECTDSFPLSFIDQPLLQYLNLGNSQFELLPSYDHLKNLRVLDVSFCSKLKSLLCLPSTLAELYVYFCESLEKITFQSHRFTLQEFGYEGCIHLYEVEGYIKLVPVAKLDETDLGHMKWLKEYQNYEVCLAGDDELITGRSRNIQMLYEFDIMSTSLPDIKDPLMTPMYISMLPSLSFDVPACPKNKRLKGINVTFKFSMSGDDCAWFCKISTTNGVVDWMYNPKVFGKPDVGEVCIWLSYWPIGNTLDTGDTVNVSILVISGLEVHECGVSLVYSDQEALENKTGWEEILGGDLSGFQLSTGAYYLCRNNFFELMEVGRLTPNWFRILVGDAIDYTEVRGWRKTGRPKHVNSSFTELKTIRCIIHGPQSEDIYNIAEMSKSSIGDKTMASTSSFIEGGMKSELTAEKMEEQKQSEGMFKAFGSDEIESDSPPHEERLKLVVKNEPSGGQEIKKLVLAVNLSSHTKRHRMIKEISELQGIKSVDYDTKEGKLTVIGAADPETLIGCARKIAETEFLSFGPALEKLAKQDERIIKYATGEGEISSSIVSAHTCRLFSLAEIQSATNNFDDQLVLGKGGFGTVYKAQISSEQFGHDVAIKRRNSDSNQGELEFRAEIDTLWNFRHLHLISPVGYCDDNEEKILVYEYMPNGSLNHHLHNAHTPLSWVARLKIAIGAARALEYLHTGVRTRYGVIHRNVKSSNILLDENWVAVISGLGLSIVGPTSPSISYVEDSVKGTFGYVDPEYFITGKLTWKTDVYSFGVVLFELLSGRRALDTRYKEDVHNLAEWAKKCVKIGKLDKMVDPRIKGSISPKCLRRFTEIANRCVQDVSKKRPTMSELVASLEALLELEEKSDLSAEKSSSIMGLPRKFYKYFVPSTKPKSDESETSSETSFDSKKIQHGK
ncbi:hypothetical protein QVD17_27580 [Tagetes erecta]|uniref:Protein kinase domain-containing protein n=1 Tax=Tagetes erecta TaxID=13708 RepID=A0AAD8KF36_TARER|nr:hypothetical protein QVD17_27580 [Tagetes erecta]